MESMVDNLNFWKGKKVLITGHTGFKGVWLSFWLKKLGANVIGYSLKPPTEINMYEIISLKNEIDSIIGNILDLENLNKVINENKPEIIIHMAAQSLVRESYKNPLETYMSNVIGTANVLEVIRKVDFVRSVVIVTSDKCYENKGLDIGYKENDSMGGYDPYSSSKGCAELVTSAYRQSFFNPKYYSLHKVALASARAGNVIGGGDFANDRVVPDMVRAGIFNKELKIRNPKATRPWQHVLEPLSGYLLLAQKLYENGIEYAEGWNFGPKDNDVKTVEWVVEEFSKRWKEKGGKLDWRIDTDSNPHEASLLKLNCTKANTVLNWQQALSVEEAISFTADWYDAYKNKCDMKKITLEQINKYENIECKHEIH
jgi:CDP-glucose 4,6-dehydratase